jgi:hypothetical protein
MRARLRAALWIFLLAPALAHGQAAAGCADPMAVVEQFLNNNDGSRFTASLALLTPDVTLATWATGVNGYHMVEKHAAGKAQVRPFLGLPGFMHRSDRPDGMVFRESEAKLSPGEVGLMLRPDRLRPNGKQYNPYRVRLRFSGCRISSITVIEQVTWL